MPQNKRKKEQKVHAEDEGIAVGSISARDVNAPVVIGKNNTVNIYNTTEDATPLTNVEIETGVIHFTKLISERAPILQNKFTSNAKKITATLGADLNSLSPVLKKQREDSYEAIKEICAEVLDISFQALCKGQNPPPYDPRSPFRGLESFRPEDSEFFFGREELVNKIVQRIKKHPFLAMLGIPGSGKSSLVMAGVIPAMGGDQVILRPGANPLTSLEAALVLTQKETLLVVDQFEELFTLSKSEDTRKTFISQLLDQVGRLRIIITMRADFLGEVALHPKLKEQFEAHQLIISPMNIEELKLSMQGQAAAVGLRFESNLIQQILDDVSGEPGAMPLLQHALWMLWKRRHGSWLKIDEYTAFGGVKQAIASTADDVLASCSDLERKQLRDIFLRLTRLDENAEGRDTRRRIPLHELIPAGGDPSNRSELLNKLVDARLVVKSAVRNESEIEVAHEALIQEWQTLRDWLTQDRQGLIIHQQLSEDTNNWLKLDRDNGSLYRGVRLQQTTEWAEANHDLLNAIEKEFLDTSKKIATDEATQSKRLKRAKSTQITLGGVAIVLTTVITVIILAINGVFASRKMDGTFNIAIAEFGEMREDGKIYPAEAGQQFSDWTASNLKKQLQENPTFQIWPNEGNIFNRTRVPLVTPETVGSEASRINADLLLYGYIDKRQSPPVLVIKFWITPQANYSFEEIQGMYGVGNPIRIVDINDPSIGISGELERQSTAIAWIGIGLSNQQLGQSTDALNAFLKAAEAMPESAMVQYFIGREYIFTYSDSPELRETKWQTAEEAFKNAIENDEGFARAYIGLGNIYYLRSGALADAALQSGQPIEPMADTWADMALESFQHVINMKPDPAEYGNPVENIARLSLGNVHRLKGSIALIKGDVPAALGALDKSIQITEQERPFFEASVSEHESHRRYLTQVYEYLGEAYEWQGFALEQKDMQLAIEAYQSSIYYFDLCIAQGEDSFDLAIKEDIINQHCQPKRKEVQERYNLISGVKP